MTRLKGTKANKLSIVIIIGLIMAFVPINTTLIFSLYSLFHRVESPVNAIINGTPTVIINNSLPGNVPIIGLTMFICGLLILGCVWIRQHNR